jgi:hypothetical protein
MMDRSRSRSVACSVHPTYTAVVRYIDNEGTE